jgi:hypothetical protein
MLLADTRCVFILPHLSTIPATAPTEAKLCAFLTHLCGLAQPPPAMLLAASRGGGGDGDLSWPEEVPTASELYKDPYKASE